jgi:hypothetical protein
MGYAGKAKKPIKRCRGRKNYRDAFSLSYSEWACIPFQQASDKANALVRNRTLLPRHLHLFPLFKEKSVKPCVRPLS